MNNKELAKHWNCSASEVKSIAKFMNERFYLWIGEKDGLFYGYMNEKITYEDGSAVVRPAISINKGFKTPAEAAKALNKICDSLQMPKLRAELMEVPVDAYKTLKKIALPRAIATHKKSYPIDTGREARN